MTKTLPPVKYLVIIGTGPVAAYFEFGTGVVGLTAARAFHAAVVAAGNVARITSEKAA